MNDDIKAYLKKIGGKGGKARAENYDSETLSKWGAMGGWPKGKKRGKKAKLDKSAIPKRSK